MSDILLIGRGSLYDVTSCLVVWSHVPSWGVSLTETHLDRDPPGQRETPVGQRPLWTETL